MQTQNFVPAASSIIIVLYCIQSIVNDKSL